MENWIIEPKNARVAAETACSIIDAIGDCDQRTIAAAFCMGG
jgi:hypothetical protein